MAIAQELIDELNKVNNLETANNIFFQKHLPLIRKENILVQWLLTKLKDDATNEGLWKTLNDWLSSNQFQELNRNELVYEDIQNIIDNFLKCLQELHLTNTSFKVAVLNCGTFLLKQKSIYVYFKSNLQQYCSLVTELILINDNNEFKSFFDEEHIFGKEILQEEKFYKYFFQTNVPTFVSILLKTEDALPTFVAVIQKCLSGKKKATWQDFADLVFGVSENAENTSIPKLYLKTISACIQKSDVGGALTVRLLTKALFAFLTDFNLIFKYTVILLEVFGFSISDFSLNHISRYQQTEILLQKSLTLTNELMNSLKNVNVVLNAIINDVSFSKFTENFLSSLMAVSLSPNKQCYNIVTSIIEINPIATECVISELIKYAMVSANKNEEQEYQDFLIVIFDVYAKLHRFQNLISKMIPTLKILLEDDDSMSYKQPYAFVGSNTFKRSLLRDYDVDKIFPERALNRLTYHVTLLASWQVMNLFKTLLFHVDSSLEFYSKPHLVDDEKSIAYIDILSKLMCWLLQSVRMIEHSISASVVEKFFKGLLELRDYLAQSGQSLLNLKHNYNLMRSYLSLCLNWGDELMALSYYAPEVTAQFNKVIDNDYTICNLTYLHSYLTKDQWCLISERITNFGNQPCKDLMQQLILQKLKALFLFEDNIVEDVEQPVLKTISLDIRENWQNLVKDKFVLTYLLPKIDIVSHEIVGGKIVDSALEDNVILKQALILDSDILMSSIVFNVFSKMSKLFKTKRKHDEINVNKPLFVKILSTIDKEMFFSKTADLEVAIDAAKTLVESEILKTRRDILVNEKNMMGLLRLLENLPCSCVTVNIQKFEVLWMFALHHSTANIKGLKTECERIIQGLVQDVQWKLLDILDVDTLIQYVLNNFEKPNNVLYFITENVFHQETLEKFESVINYLLDDLKSNQKQQYLLQILDFINKLKKVKTSADTKSLCLKYRSNIFEAISKFIGKDSVKNESIELVAHCLKYFLTQNENLPEKLETKVREYISQILSDDNADISNGVILFFTTILHHAQKLKNIVSTDFTTRLWQFCKLKKCADDSMDKYSQLLVIVFEHLPNENFKDIIPELVDIGTKSFKAKNVNEILYNLEVWTSIMSCSFNSTKSQILCSGFDDLLIATHFFINEKDYDLVIFEKIVELDKSIIQNHRMSLTTAMIGSFILKPSLFLENNENFHLKFTKCICYLELLLKHRHALIMDRLNAFLKQFRILLSKLCLQCKIITKNEESEMLSDCAHQLEKLTKLLVLSGKHLTRISPYIIADILHEYEKVTIVPNVKLHLNNCIYSFLSLCDEHAIAFSMRVLSDASREIFKDMYQNYKKYYRFTGKI